MTYAGKLQLNHTSIRASTVEAMGMTRLIPDVHRMVLTCALLQNTRLMLYNKATWSPLYHSHGVADQPWKHVTLLSVYTTPLNSHSSTFYSLRS